MTSDTFVLKSYFKSATILSMTGMLLRCVKKAQPRKENFSIVLRGIVNADGHNLLSCNHARELSTVGCVLHEILSWFIRKHAAKRVKKVKTMHGPKGIGRAYF